MNPKTHLNPTDSTKMSDQTGRYLDYLDKEMSIMGVLSTFCLAVPSLCLERVISADDKSIAHDFLVKLWGNGSPYLVIASGLMLCAAAFYYKQRSLLAWYYGQIALKMALPDYTARKLDQWLKDADSWETWIRYHWANHTIIFAGMGYALAIASIYVEYIHIHCRYFAVTVLVLFGLTLALIRRNSTRFKYDEEPHLFCIY
jgi:hypothetical protein